jgi:hypothetical protein
LLRAVSTELAVSSVYRDRADLIDRLVDGDMTTAWNSRSSDLVGAWVEARVPAEATVTSVALTVGFNKRDGETDLFLGNHRVSRVRVLRDGQELGQFDLDIANPELQEVAVQGPGGVYRVEVLSTVEGTRSSWREVCISELRVWGRAPEATPEARLPRMAVAELPPPRVVSAPDPSALAASARAPMTRFLRAWTDAGRRFAEAAVSSGEPELRDAEEARLLRTRARLIRDVAELVDPVDPRAADAARVSARGEAMDPTAALAAFARLAELSEDAGLRCDWARMHARAHISGLVAHLTRDDNASESYYDPTPEGDRDRHSMARRSRAVRPMRQLDAALRRGEAIDPSALDGHDLSAFDPNWTPLLAQLQEVTRLCAPASPPTP